MAKPPRLEKLKHGRLLSGKVFRFFVETWNWLVGAFDNMRGDADINPNEGMISVDRTDPDNLVIRFVGKLGTATSDFIHPFTVRWSTEADGWIIALGDVTYCGKAVRIDGVEDIPAYPSPWKRLSMLSKDGEGEIYLNLSNLSSSEDDDSGYDSSPGVTAKFSFGVDDEAELSVKIATITKDEYTSVVKIRQHVTSALHLGGGGECRWVDPTDTEDNGDYEGEE